jgi:hypothetical protein
VNQSDLGEYKQNAREKQNIQYTRKNTNSPSNQAIQMVNINFPRRSTNWEESRGLVKMSVNYLFVSMYLISMSPFSTWSLRKWCIFSTCLIFLWKTEFLATEIALLLSHIRGTLSNITLKSLMVCTIQIIYEQQLHTQPRWWTVQ